MNILHIDSSITGSRSVSRELSALVVAQLGGDRPAVPYRAHVAPDLPHLTAASAPSAHPLSGAAPTLDEAQQAARDTSDAVLVEFMSADTVVIGVPMYNFTLPSQLKAWIDRLLVPGTTFRYGPNGPEGQAGGKRIVLAIARGGYYGEESAFAAAEHAESFLRTAFGFIGVTEIEAVVAEGLNVANTKDKAITAAHDAVRRLAA